jgi:hypothetical protein
MLKYLVEKKRSTSNTKEIVVNDAFVKDAVIANLHAMRAVPDTQDIVDLEIHPEVNGKRSIKIYYRKEASLRPKKTE